VVVEQRRPARVILIGGDARRLRALRLFLDSLGIFEAVALATGGAGLNGLTRQRWNAAVVVDDLNDMPPEQLIATAAAQGARVPVVALVPVPDRARVHALYEAGAVEVMQIGASPSPDLARALARAIERQELLDRITHLETEVVKRQIVDEETGLYASWRFDEDWRLEQIRAKRRGGDLSVLGVRVETSPPIVEMPPRERTMALRTVARAVRAALREGDFAAHDGSGFFRVLLSDAGSGVAAQEAGKLAAAARAALQANGITANVAVDVMDSFQSVAAGVAR
jgi:PleD family two-component response regulator